jgi:hypothetical protein
MSMFRCTKVGEQLNRLRLSFTLLTVNNIVDQHFSHPHSLVLVDCKYKYKLGNTSESVCHAVRKGDREGTTLLHISSKK